MEPPNLTSPELLAKWKHVLDATFDIWTWDSPAELAWLAECASMATFIREVGCYHGRSTKVMALANPAARIVTVDLPESVRCEAIARANLREFDCGDDTKAFVAYVKMNSANIDWSHFGEKNIEYGFIDGGHLYEHVEMDIRNMLPHMAPGGVISGHDWRANDMNDGVNRGVLAHFKLEELRFWESIWYVRLP